VKTAVDTGNVGRVGRILRNEIRVNFIAMRLQLLPHRGGSTPVTKLVAAGMTGSAAMLSEAVHSFVAGLGCRRSLTLQA
jgi:hypothetical protein